MPKPFMIIEKNLQVDEDEEDSMMSVDQDQDQKHDCDTVDRTHVKKIKYLVKGLAYEKYLFNIRPQTIMKSAQYLSKN